MATPAGNGDEATLAGGPGPDRHPLTAPTTEQPWVGRARPVPAPPPAEDPYWPPAEPAYPVTGYPVTGYPVTGYPVTGHPAPHPGYPPPRRRSRRTTLLIVGGVLAACCAGGATAALLGGAVIKDAFRSVTGSSNADPGAGDGARDEPGADRKGGGDTDRGGPDGSGAGLNTPVRDGKFEFVVSAVDCGHDTVGTSLINTKAKGQFCLVSIEVTNIGTEAQTFADVFQKALGPDGTVYGADPGAGVIANQGGGLLWKVVNPGTTVSGTIVYDIPDGAEIASLELHDSLLSGGVTVAVA